MWSAVFIFPLLIGESLTWQDYKTAKYFLSKMVLILKSLEENLTSHAACICSHGRCLLYNARRQIAEKVI